MASHSTFSHPHLLTNHNPLHEKPISAAADFPTDFPYDSAVNSPVDSLLGSDDDEEDFLAALTQRLTNNTLRDSHRVFSLHKSQAKTAVAGSPQSTLSGFGSWSGWSSVSSDGSPNGPSLGPSPPTTPFGGGDNTWDLIHAAAKQVARLEVNNLRDGVIGSSLTSSNLVSPVKFNQFGTELPICKPENFFNRVNQVNVENQQIHCRGGDFHHENRRFVVRPEDFPHHRRNPSTPCAPVVSSAFYGGRSGPKKECAGTGVFLPRRYDKNPPQPRQRADCGSNPPFQGKNVQNLNRSVPQTTSSHRLPPSFEAVMAHGNAILAQQQRLSYSRPAERSQSHELLLPQEWTY